MFKRLFSFYGKASRQVYWFIMFTPLLVASGGLIAFASICVVFSEFKYEEFTSDTLAESVTQFFGSALMILRGLTWISLQLASLWWQLTVFARRSRSAGVSPHWTWIYVLMYLLSPFLVPALIVIVMWIVWGVLPPKEEASSMLASEGKINRIEPTI